MRHHHKTRRYTFALGIIAALAVSMLNPMRAEAAPTDVVINELMYGPASEIDGDEFLELYNRGAAPVDLSGWSFSGITLVLPRRNDYCGQRVPRRRQGRGSVPVDVRRRRACRDLHRLALQRRRGDHPPRRGSGRDRHRHVRRRRAVARDARRAGRLARTDRRVPRQQRLPELGGLHRAQRFDAAGAANSVARTGLGPASRASRPRRRRPR